MTKWIPVIGNIKQLTENNLLFEEGEKILDPNTNQQAAGMSLVLCNHSFVGGTLSAEVIFEKTDPRSTFEFVLYYDPNGYQLNAGISNAPFFTIRHFDNQQTKKWFYHASGGGMDLLEAGRHYQIDVRMKGSFVKLFVDEVEVLATNLPLAFPQSQVGFWCVSEGKVHINRFTVQPDRAKAFVIMQFSEPYNYVYEQVIRKVCDEFKLETVRADESSSVGLVISDIEQNIKESNIIVADISPQNPNVYYEVGYAHAVNKPTVLIAKKDTRLPFDVSPFRTLFYEDSIRGKIDLENGLKRHFEAILHSN